MGESWVGGRIVTKSSAGEVAGAQGAPVQHHRLVSLSSPRRAVYVEHKFLLVHETVLDDARSR